MADKKIQELQELYRDSKSQDRALTAEMRTNVMLVSGEHYTKKSTGPLERTREHRNEDSKLRITFSYLHLIYKTYVSSIIAQAPGVSFRPTNPLELQDQKDAELNQAVWNFEKNRSKLKRLIREFAEDFVGVSECAGLIRYDNDKGPIKGYEALTDEAGNPVMDEMGVPLEDKARPVRRGEFIFDRWFAFNIFRDPHATSIRDCRWIGHEKLVSTKELKRQYKGQEEKQKFITDSSGDFIVFDSKMGGYRKEKGNTLVLEYYYKPCLEYPNGYFYITTQEGILEEGELPGGIFPVVWAGFDEFPSRVRASSILKVARPFQAEINRAASQQAMHQITVGDDKILYQAGTKLTQGSLLPGIRGLEYQGVPPTVIEGRTGEQFASYIRAKVEEMFMAVGLEGLLDEKTTNLDPYTLLYKSMNTSQKFSTYSEKFGEFLVDLGETYINLAKFYLQDDEVINMVGRSEAVNISEFRDTDPLCFSCVVEEQTDTADSKLGKQLAYTNILQYVGQQLSRDDIGKMTSDMPFGIPEETFSDLMINSKNVKNDFLAIERGEQPMTSDKDDSDYILSQLALRMKQRDFGLLPENVKQIYFDFETFHLQKVQAEQEAAAAAKNEFIPVGGAMIACDMYTPNEDPEKSPKRVRVPYQALEWMLKMLESQGMPLNKMEQMNQAQLAQLQQMGGQGMPQDQGQMPQGQPMPQQVAG